MTRKVLFCCAVFTFGLLSANSMSQVFNWAIEAEWADHIEGGMIIAEDPNASGGKFIWTVGAPATVNPRDLQRGWVEYKINIPTAGTYAIWGKVIAWDGDSDSFWVAWQSTDADENLQQPNSLWDVETGQEWHWDRINHRPADEKVDVEWELPAGESTLRIRTREDATMLDALFITDNLSADEAEANPRDPTEADRLAGGLLPRGVSAILLEDRVVNPGDQFTMDISVLSDSALHRFTFDLAFDPAILQVMSITEGNFLSRDVANTTEWSTPEIDNGKGIATHIECKRTTADGMTGTAALAFVTFKAQRVGNSKIRVENLRLFSPDGEQIPARMKVGSVEVFPHGTISGVVIDTKHQTPIPKVEIEVSNKWSRLKKHVYSDPEGRYTISHVPVGNVNVKAKRQGFFATTTKVLVRSGEEISNVDLQMKPSRR